MRAEAASLRKTCQQRVHELGDLFVTVDDPTPGCVTCGKPMRVQKTQRRHGVTLAHGMFHLQETVYACTPACRQSGQSLASRAPTLAAILPPGSVVGYDVMVAVGLDRFVHHRQREEIRAALARDYGVALSTGEISTLAGRFLAYLHALHRASAPALAAALEADGGWPLHLDATGEDGRGTLLVAYAGSRHWVLGAWKIPTERAECILPAIQEIARAFGPPCAIMRDLGRAMTEAAKTFVASLPARIPILACHYHFLADIGEDLLTKGHDQLRTLFRQAEIVARLRAFVRHHGERLGSAIEQGREGLRQWLAESPAGHRVPEGRNGLAVVRSLAQWVLDYHAEGTDEGFPFDVPYLALYDRCLQVTAAIGTFLREAPADRQVQNSLERLQQILRPIDCDVPPFMSVSTALTRRVEFFAELRDALRLNAKDRKVAATTEPVIATLEDIQGAVTALETSLRAQRPARGPAQDVRQAIDIILTHLDRHGPHLWGHAITIPAAGGGTTIRLVDRTNDCLESYFHGIKHGERRRSGRKVLTQDFERLPAAAALAVNLTRADYVEIVCRGSLDRLSAAFAALDRGNRSRSVAARATAPSVYAETASLSAADRRVIRMSAMVDRIVSAAQAR